MEQLLETAARAGIKFLADGENLRVIAPEGAMTAELQQGLREHKGEILKMLQAGTVFEEVLPELESDIEHRNIPFPLTDIQHAYWLGRDGFMEMGNIATHLYVELDCDNLDIKKLNVALCKMIDRHDMLRVIIAQDGKQQILAEVPPYNIARTDLSNSTQVEIEQAIDLVRDDLSHQVFKTDQWPLFEVRATQLPNKNIRLHISLDLLILDASSIFLFFQEWSNLYINPQQQKPDFTISFREYVLAEQSLQSTKAYQRAYSYWMDRVDTLPTAPDLPLRAENKMMKKPKFSRREHRIEKSRWNKLKKFARTEGLTPSGILLAAYAETLARWSTTPHFTLNVTVSNRLQIHPEINHILGDFTSLVMHEVDHRDKEMSFIDFARQQQKLFATDLDHRELSGVKVLREWSKRRGTTLQAAMPVVFSSGLIWSGDDEVGDLEQLGKKVYSISQTSQVWLDHHVMELGGDLSYVWDAADEVFEPGVLDAMFSSYCDLVERLVDDPAVWEQTNVINLPIEMQQRLEQSNQTDSEIVNQTLHAGFVTHALKNPELIALITDGREMSYGQLLAASSAIANRLLEKGQVTGEPVAILMHKGWEQIVAVFGVLLAGCAYMPIDADLPTKRQLDLLRIGEVKNVIIQSGVVHENLIRAEYNVIEVGVDMAEEYSAIHAKSLEINLQQLAYIIFTSGTTGVPKGVMIDHLGAVNTTEHINKMFEVGEADRVLAVSSLSFDLSVYDIFGVLAAGGALVIPEYHKGHDPVHWRDLIQKHNVTLWNSAPQLMRMLMDSYHDNEEDSSSLSTVLLSGDFIPLDLPEKIQRRNPQAKVISLGGATEASIWSIYYTVQTVQTKWSSIPYGKPLPNQQIWVYDNLFMPCPVHVQGRIYIGGQGLAKGYWRDETQTSKRFIIHPQSGERLYDTGDLGMYEENGNVLILGRDDGQIKIRGFRVELGEIESVLRQHADIEQVAVMATTGSHEQRQLVAYIETGEYTRFRIHNDPEQVKSYLADHLPEYMVPRHIIFIDSMPVSSNGKIDYKALPVIEDDLANETRELILPRNEAEQKILSAWSDIIVGFDISVTDNFFELGGDSILATQLVRGLNEAMPQFSLEMHELFENLTIESLANLYMSRGESEQISIHSGAVKEQTVKYSGPLADTKTLFDDIHEVVESFNDLDFIVRSSNDNSLSKDILLTGVTGWFGVHVLAELMQQTSAQVYCLLRTTDPEQGRKRVIENMEKFGLTITASNMERLKIVCGDLSQDYFGLDSQQWQNLTKNVSAIYHLGASVSVLVDYKHHKNINISSLSTMVQLATQHHLKPIFYTSPMAVSRRFQDGGLVVLPEERAHIDPQGLQTAYAQSKWSAEQILLAASQRGLPVKIYRSSHALPSSDSGIAKPNDTYGNILQVACQAGVVPDWTDSGLNGVPVDILSRLLVTNSLVSDDYHGVVHIENQHPLSLKSVMETLLKLKNTGICTTGASLEQWQNKCLEVADTLPDETAGLAKVLFADRQTGTAVENMFRKHSFDLDYFSNRGELEQLENLTPTDYWHKVYQCQQW